MSLTGAIQKYLIGTAGVDPQKFEQPDLKVSDLALDSLGLVEMLFEVEDQFGFQIPDPSRYQTMSFADMVADIERLVREQNDGKLPEIALTGTRAEAQ